MANIYYSDLDGTLLNPEGLLGSEQRERLRRLIESGIHFSVATGRTMEAIRSELQDLPITLPVIENNGSYLTDYASGEKLVINYFPHDHLEEIIHTFLDSPNSPLFLLVEDGVERMITPRDQLNPGMEAYRDFRLALAPGSFHVVDDISGLPWDQLVNLQAIGPKPDILVLAEQLLSYPEQYEVHAMSSYDGWWYANIASHDSSKAHGLELVRRELDPKDQIVVFGDNINDIPMLKVADVSIAVGNAAPEVKAVADIVIGNHWDDVVIDFIERHRNEAIQV